MIMFLFTSYFTTRVGRGVWTCSSAKLDSPHQPWKVSQQGRNPSSSAFQTGLASQHDQTLMYQLHHINACRLGLGHRHWMLYNQNWSPIQQNYNQASSYRRLGSTGRQWDDAPQFRMQCSHIPHNQFFKGAGGELQELYPNGLFPL